MSALVTAVPWLHAPVLRVGVRPDRTGPCRLVRAPRVRRGEVRVTAAGGFGDLASEGPPTLEMLFSGTGRGGRPGSAWLLSAGAGVWSPEEAVSSRGRHRAGEHPPGAHRTPDEN